MAHYNKRKKKKHKQDAMGVPTQSHTSFFEYMIEFSLKKQLGIS